MSAVTAVPSWVTPAMTGMTPMTVPSSRAVPVDPAAPRRTAPASARHGHLRVVPDLPAIHDVPRPAAHITRRGRLAITLCALLLCLTGGVAGARAAMGGAPAPTYDTVVVQSGQTLSQVAHHAYPQMSIGNAVQRVQAANELNTLQVFAGESLRLPR
ncbi:hypothetical protein [Allobranchiibius sp. CTAmp26]|uniref:hypothetical protein n=1 Tax=Allobranchiibius sp. CTAmp26 TaxID=2815214 RepID=UPI001AA0E5C3|nr:hypothetical protein [Allobranchiibius sp. CTAmp26]MBO1755192.1 hypothetical protein [Allobranchiibius sp. CTAmp26]